MVKFHLFIIPQKLIKGMDAFCKKGNEEWADKMSMFIPEDSFVTKVQETATFLSMFNAQNPANGPRQTTLPCPAPLLH